MTKATRINVRNQDRIKSDGRVENVDEFSYVGATICNWRGKSYERPEEQNFKRGAFVRLRRTKLRLYRTLVVPVLLHGCETWKTDEQRRQQSSWCVTKHVPTRILRIRWQEHVSTEKLLERADMKLLSEKVKWRRWKVIGLILRQDNNGCNIAITRLGTRGKAKKR